MIYLSVVVPVKNESRYIKNTLEMLVNQNYPIQKYEIIVVDGMSSDNTRQIVNDFILDHSHLNICLLDNPGFLSSRARNIGVRASKGQFIAVIDGHVHIPNNNLFLNIEATATKNNALCLSRPAPLDAPTVKKGMGAWIATARKSWLGHSSKSFIYSDFSGFVDPVSAGFAYDRSVFDKVGFFDESFDAAEDVEFHYRLKKENILSYIDPELLIYSFPRDSLRSLFHQQVRYGIGRAKCNLKHPDSATFETLIPVGILFLSLFIPFSFFTFHFFPILTSLFWFLSLVYFSTLLATGIFSALNKGHFFPSFIIFSSIWLTHCGIGWGYTRGIFISIFTRYFKNVQTSLDY